MATARLIGRLGGGMESQLIATVTNQSSFSRSEPVGTLPVSSRTLVAAEIIVTKNESRSGDGRVYIGDNIAEVSGMTGTWWLTFIAESDLDVAFRTASSSRYMSFTVTAYYAEFP